MFLEVLTFNFLAVRNVFGSVLKVDIVFVHATGAVDGFFQQLSKTVGFICLLFFMFILILRCFIMGHDHRGKLLAIRESQFSRRVSATRKSRHRVRCGGSV